jgi:acyl carrier protein
VSTTLERLTEVFRDVFEDDDLEVARETTAYDVEEWDSLMHVSLVVAVEREFNLRFKSSQVDSLQCVGDLIALIEGQ